MPKRTTIDSLAAEITKGLKEYSKLTEESLKGAVVEVSNEVRDKIKEVFRAKFIMESVENRV